MESRLDSDNRHTWLQLLQIRVTLTIWQSISWLVSTIQPRSGNRWEDGNRSFIDFGIYQSLHAINNQNFPGSFSSSMLDIFPTIVTLANGTLPANRQYDGIDISNILRGGAQKGHQVCTGIR